jgi:hypothetical protein
LMMGADIAEMAAALDAPLSWATILAGWADTALASDFIDAIIAVTGEASEENTVRGTKRVRVILGSTRNRLQDGAVRLRMQTGQTRDRLVLGFRRNRLMKGDD